MLSNDHGYVNMCIDFCYTHCVDQGQGQRQGQLQRHLKSKGQGHQRSKVKVTGEMNYNMQYFRSMKHYTCKIQGHRALADFHFYAFYHYIIYEKISCDEKLDWQQSSGCSLIAYKQGDAYGSENYSCKDRNRLTTSLYIPIFTTDN